MTDRDVPVEVGTTEDLVRYGARYLSDQKGRRGLHAGCGRGSSTVGLMEILGCYMVGIAASKEDASAAEDRLKGMDLADEGIFMCMDPSSTCLPSASFDLVWIDDASEQPRREPYARFGEMNRLTKEGGKMVVTVTCSREEGETGAHYERALIAAGWSVERSEDVTDRCPNRCGTSDGRLHMFWVRKVNKDYPVD
jgi:ubiquinone/menaquinone biosynthesis C-methylase UbiE